MRATPVLIHSFIVATNLGALKATGNRGLQPAMDHILENEGKPVPALDAVTEAARPGAAGGVDQEAKSIKCSQCGKTFKNTALANFHAEKSGHDQFEESTEEIKPLTEEEKKERLAELRAKMADKRARKAVEDAAEQKANENLRRKAGKDMDKIRDDLKAKEVIKEAEQKRREKIEEQQARARVKAQIEADKKERAEKAAREKALREGKPLPDSGSASAPAPVAASTSGSSGVAGKDFKETRLQIRMSTGGQPYTTTLPSDSPLREVAEFVAAQNLSVNVDTVTLAQHFPR
ncbi:hypothetical protein V5O48_006400 [Marasmius crinis-equi]|uniref:C2H2-type domain-containing protein n=1 Tax=Marasmius crinis-equi TaxID=585013 RepID=A0ABR3FKI8_9AGAR